MERKRLFIVIAVIIVFSGIGGSIYMVKDRFSSAPVTVETTSTTPTPTPVKSLTWSDPNGFSFTYPDDVTVDKHDEDDKNYAHIEMTHTSHPGSLIVWAKDVPLNAKHKPITTPDEWIALDNSLKEGAVIDTTFAGVTGKKILVSADTQKIVIGTISDNILFYIETTASDLAYWNQATDMVANSFAFIPLEGETQNTSEEDSLDTGGYEQAVDEEETLE